MMKGKLIVIEGTDCSGKETQTKLLIEKLHKKNINIERMCFPNYDTPTGKIVGGPYLGKSNISEGLFQEGAINVDPKVASLYYAADRKYNLPKIKETLEEGKNVILDRYVESNAAHQGGKYADSEERREFYSFIDALEYGLLELPEPDIRIFLYVPYEFSAELNKKRAELSDQHEKSKEHLINAENAYLEICDIYGYKKIICVKDNELRTIEDINKEIYTYIELELA